jgi:protein SCO1
MTTKWRLEPILTFFGHLLIALVSASYATAQPRQAPGLPASSVPPVLREVGFDQNLNQQIPLDITFTDESGDALPLASYFGSRPVVLALVYYGCPMLCTQALNSLASTLGVLSIAPGRDFEVVTVSFDPRETAELARAKKTTYIERTGHREFESGWHFLTGDQSAIARLTSAAGFRYVWDDTVQQYAHPTGIIVLTADGRIARYLFGIDYGPRDLRLAILDAKAHKVSSPVEQALLYCYHYDLATGRYSLAIMRIVQVAGLVTVLSLATLIVVLRRREHRFGT